MLTVHTAPTVEINLQHGWEITFWVADAFDYSFPFRDTLREIAEYLGVENADNGLPPYDRHEDFVDGSLLFGQSEVGVYFEHALGYLMLFSPEGDVLDRLAAIVFPYVALK